MKIRNGFVSNSSSTSFVLDISDMPKSLKDKINRLTERSGDSSRCTGKITNLTRWAKSLLKYYPDDANYKQLLEYSKNKNIIIIRESDEAMGGTFADHCFSVDDIKPYMMYSFDYH